jgi:mono/diheme cytochrome c family protein
MVLTAVLSVGCNYQKTTGGSSSTSVRGSLQNCGGDTSYASVAKEIFVPRCSTCHGMSRQTRGINTESYNSVVANLGKIRTMVSQGLMPQGGLPADERQYLVDWIDAGAPESPSGSHCGSNGTSSSPATTAGTVPDPTAKELAQENFAWLNQKYFQARCIFCHGPRKGHRTLVGYEDFMQYVDTSDPENSLLVKSLRRSNEFIQPMPPDGSGFQPFTADEINDVLGWIRAGAPDAPPPIQQKNNSAQAQKRKDHP